MTEDMPLPEPSVKKRDHVDERQAPLLPAEELPQVVSDEIASTARTIVEAVVHHQENHTPSSSSSKTPLSFMATPTQNLHPTET